MYDKLMIVAHPDDESIFGGANLLKEKGWKVICLTNGNDVVRSKEFLKAMNIAEASYEIWDYPDEREGIFEAEQLKKDLDKSLRKNQVQCIVTHNLTGEYGHNQHISLSKILHEFKYNNLYVFDQSQQILPFKLLKKKLNLLSVYQSQMEGNIEKLMYYVAHERLIQFS